MRANYSMTDAAQGNLRETAFRQARSGNLDAFADWMGMVEIPLRRSLTRFAGAVDVEVVLQETLMRMWLFATDTARPLEGENASLRFACRVAKNVALEEIRKYRHERFVDLDKLENLPEGALDPHLPDPALRRAISECVQRLPEQPRRALMARICEGHLPDRELAERVLMKANTFLQNIVRARRLVADCLGRRGIRLAEILS